MQALPAIASQPEAVPGQFIPTQSTSDSQTINLWLHGKAPTTQRGYKREIASFLAFVEKPLQWVTLGDLQRYSDSLGHLAPRTQCRTLAAIKSLLSFAQKIGYVRFNAGAPLSLPKPKNDLAERILSEEETARMIALATGRDRVLLRFLYASGCRCSEVLGIRWRDFAEASEGRAIVTVYGKGSRTRHILLPGSVWRDVQSLKRPEDGPNDAPFRSRLGKPLSQPQLWRIVRTAAKRAGITRPVSPHWWRHACASHSLDRGAPVHVVQKSLGHASLSTTSIYAHCRPSEGAALYLGLD